MSQLLIKVSFLGECVEILGEMALKKELDAKYSVRLASPTGNGPRARGGTLTKRLLASRSLLVKE